MNNEYINLQQILKDNAKTNKNGLGAAHWNACVEMVQPLVDTEKITLEGLDALFTCADNE